MKGRPFVIVDVFAEEKYSGNELAVVRRARDLSPWTKQKIAREFNFSETAFILRDEPSRGGFDVRIFTPRQEVPFAGHPTLGTAFVIQQDILKERVKEVVLNLKIGRIPVTFSYRGARPDILWMRQNEPRFGKTVEPANVAPALGLRPADFDPEFPSREVSTGLPFLIVPLRTLEAIRRCRVEGRRMIKLIEGLEAKGVCVFCPETCNPKNSLHVRVFAGGYGVPEDPATGSANGCLAGYLVRTRYFGSARVDLRVEQGHEVGRPSLLLLRAEETKGKTAVQVGGRVFPVARGELV